MSCIKHRTLAKLDPFILPRRNVSLGIKLQRYTYKYEEQESCGCVVFYATRATPADMKILMIERKYPLTSTSEWVLPKGRKKPTDTTRENTAAREVYEETGLKVKIVQELDHYHFTFYEDTEKLKITKTVYYFLATSDTLDTNKPYVTDDNSDESKNIKQLRWVSTKEAINLVEHKPLKAIIEKAGQLIYNRQA